MIENEQKDFRREEEVVTNETAGVPRSDMGNCKDKAEGSYSPSAKTVETTETQGKVVYSRAEF